MIAAALKRETWSTMNVSETMQGGKPWVRLVLMCLLAWALVYYTWQITLCELSCVNLKDLMFFVLVNVLRIWACIKISSQVQSSFIVLVQHGVTQPDSVVIPLYYTIKTREKPMHSCRESLEFQEESKWEKQKHFFWADNMAFIFKVGWVMWFRNIFSCFNYLHIPKAIISIKCSDMLYLRL